MNNKFKSVKKIIFISHYYKNLLIKHQIQYISF